MAFQTLVGVDQAPGLEGGWSSANPWSSVIAGPGELTADTAGLIIGRFGFARNDTGKTSNAVPGVAYRAGFVSRYQPVLINAWPAQASNTVQAGLEVTLHDAGDFWARSLTVATIGQKVFSSDTTGQVSTGAAGATIAGSTERRWYVHSAGAAGELIKISHRAV